MLFELSKKRITKRIIILLALTAISITLSYQLPYRVLLLMNQIPISFIIVNVFRLREKRSYDITDEILVYHLNQNTVRIPLQELSTIRNYSPFGMGIYNQYLIEYEGYYYEVYEDYENLKGESLVEILTNDYELIVRQFKGMKFALKVKERIDYVDNER